MFEKTNSFWKWSNYVWKLPNFVLNETEFCSMKDRKIAYSNANPWNIYNKLLTYIIFVQFEHFIGHYFEHFFRALLLKRLLQECSCHLILICLVFPLNNDTFTLTFCRQKTFESDIEWMDKWWMNDNERRLPNQTLNEYSNKIICHDLDKILLTLTKNI